MRCLYPLLVLIALVINIAADSGMPRFVEKEVINFSAAYGMGSGVSAADYDGDGDVDLFLPTGAGHASKLLQNQGDGSFIEVQYAAGLDAVSSTRAALWIDIDGDGQLDLLTAGDRWNVPLDQSVEDNALRLYQQVDGRFNEITRGSGIDRNWITQSRAHLGGLCVGDINNDGFIDIMVSVWGGSGNRLYLNNRNGTFAEIAQLSDLRSPANYWQPIMCDFDLDGWTDIYSAIDFAPNALWVNQRNLRFHDRGFTSGSDNHMNDMGVTLGDYDNDGDFDLFVTNIEREGTRSVLLRNDFMKTELRFTEVAHESGVVHSGWAWGCTFFDADNDGWLDLALTNGWPDTGEYLPDLSRLYQNDHGKFNDISKAANFADSLWGSSLIAVDIDGDGDRDLIQTCIEEDSTTGHLRILENILEAEKREQTLIVMPRMMGSNRFAIGARIQARLRSGLTLSRRISAGCSFLGQEPYRAVFGLGDSEVETVSVAWPDGTWTEIGSQSKGSAISPVNRNPDRFVSIESKAAGSDPISVIWHGGGLQKGAFHSQGVEWSPLLQPANPYRIVSDSAHALFRVQTD